MKKIKKIMIAFILFLLIVSVTIAYYSVRLPAKSVIPHLTQIENIYFSYLKGNKITPYKIEFNDKNTEIDQLMSIFDSVSYTRSLGSKNIRNGNTTLAIIFLYRDSDGKPKDYFLDINEHGFIISDKKKFKIVRRETEVFKQLSTWLFENGIEQPT
ncbi:hypothetical protein [Paenibacillus sp. EZ-K15]|uniref:hypothetical protein n=1 Tax=Paenibacillus sp. EZ-K15 TaxID=2044275 RepID=UPI000BF44785|nr:hypothetical protein [Paenibacillus sp. EZ-K15]